MWKPQIYLPCWIIQRSTREDIKRPTLPFTAFPPETADRARNTPATFTESLITRSPSQTAIKHQQLNHLMTPEDSPGHFYESNESSWSGALQPAGPQPCMSVCSPHKTTLRCVTLCTALRWSHPRGVRMKIGEVPPSPR